MPSARKGSGKGKGRGKGKGVSGKQQTRSSMRNGKAMKVQ